jgi:hypothetical protein
VRTQVVAEGNLEAVVAAGNMALEEAGMHTGYKEPGDTGLAEVADQVVVEEVVLAEHKVVGAADRAAVDRVVLAECRIAEAVDQAAVEEVVLAAHTVAVRRAAVEVAARNTWVVGSMAEEVAGMGWEGRMDLAVPVDIQEMEVPVDILQETEGQVGMHHILLKEMVAAAAHIALGDLGEGFGWREELESQFQLQLQTDHPVAAAAAAAAVVVAG